MELDKRKSLGARLTIIRGEQMLTQEEFATSLGVSTRAYQDFEKGKRSVPSDMLIALSEEYAVNLNWLMRGLEVANLDGYEAAANEFVLSLHRHLQKRGDKLSPENIAAIVSRWLAEMRNGREISIDNIHVWIDLMRRT